MVGFDDSEWYFEDVENK